MDDVLLRMVLPETGHPYLFYSKFVVITTRPSSEPSPGKLTSILIKICVQHKSPQPDSLLFWKCIAIPNTTPYLTFYCWILTNPNVVCQRF